ncbi:hypothetical protein NBE98_19470 [Clostridium swellfunianum]|uniref:hypothetical protein n=1 Tax=Clostridium swellfunianum TaxID=1367462 RepID=UPI00202FDEA6|nr:hypothetical protein [Clostridium swellfunianum]MCM0650549.1 hypothetical protein [Clostridium swellfunianum]
MEGVYTAKREEVSIIRIFVKSRTHNAEEDRYGFALDVECYDVFLTDAIKEEVERLSALVLSYAPELQVYRHIKDKEPIMEFRASQAVAGCYKVSVATAFEEYLKKVKNYSDIISLISKGIIERISFLFGAYSLDRY